MTPVKIIKPVFLFLIFLSLFGKAFAGQSGYAYPNVRYSKARVIEVVREVEKGERGAEGVIVQFLSGEFKGIRAEVKNIIWEEEGYNVRVEPGKKVTVRSEERPGARTQFYISGRWRSPWIFAAAAVFGFLFLFTAGIRRWPALAALMLNVGAVFYLVIPLLQAGYPPFLTVLVVQGITGGITLRLVLGGGKKFIAAFLGAVAGVAAGGVLALEFVKIMNLTGFFFPGARMLQAASRYMAAWNITDFSGLFAAGIMIASMGAVADIAVSVSSGCWEVALKFDFVEAGSICKSGINIGRDIIATMLNSLVLAFTALALPLISVMYILDIPLIMAINFEFFISIAASALIASIALVLTVPATASACGLIFKKP